MEPETVFNKITEKIYLKRFILIEGNHTVIKIGNLQILMFHTDG